MADSLLPPLAFNVPIVDYKTGFPSPQFQRLMQQLTLSAELSAGSGGSIGIASGGVTDAMLATMPASTIKGNKEVAVGPPENLTLSQVLDLIGSAAWGDILFRGTAGWQKLAAGTSGNVLTTAGAGANPTWAAAGGGLTRISTQTLAATAASVSFTSIPATYKDLILVGQARSTVVATADNIRCQLNGDTGANYDFERETRFGPIQGNAQTYMEITSVAGSTAPANIADTFEMIIANYAATVFHKMVRTQGEIMTAATANNLFRSIASGRWRNTAAVSRIDIISPASLFVIGSTFSLYGRK
jgi:hypothetical protein